MTRVALRGLKGRLIASSIDAYVLALESINRISIRYRIEAFNLLIVNAWELLLKAQVIHLANNSQIIMQKKKRDDRPRSWDIMKCIEHIYTDPNDQRRANLEFVIEERHKSAHLVLDRLPKDLLSIYQACVVNYHQSLEEWFGISLSDRVPVGMMTLVYDLSPAVIDLTNAVVIRNIGAETALYLMERQKRFEEVQQRVGAGKQFAAELHISVEIANNPVNANVQLRKGMGGGEVGVVGKPRDSQDTHPYRTCDVVARINEMLGGRAVISAHDILYITHRYHTKQNNNHFYQSRIKGSPPQYSEAFAIWVLPTAQFDRRRVPLLRGSAAEALWLMRSRQSAKCELLRGMRGKSFPETDRVAVVRRLRRLSIPAMVARGIGNAGARRDPAN